MMQGMRNFGQSIVGKLIVGVLFALLILSFAIWGIGDIFRGGFGRNIVAQVGSTDVTVEQLRTAYQDEIQRVTRQERRGISQEMARARGIDRQVFSRLTAEATLDENAKRLGLAVSDATIAQMIVSEPTFRGADGTFNRARFDDLLRNNNLTEQRFVAEQRQSMLRNHIAEAIGGGMTVPTPMLDAIHRYANERRAVDYIALPASSVGEITGPDEAALKTYFEERKAAFRAPEYRTAIVLTLTPETLAASQNVSDADVAAAYERVKSQRFGTAERRLIQQIVFQNAGEAAAAHEKINAGASFADIARERNIAEADLALGRLTRSEMIDPAVAEAAFALEAGAVSAPVAGRFGTVIVRVAEIDAANVRPLVEVEDELRRELALERARAGIADLHDKIEDQRASARPLAEIAKEFSLTPMTLDAVDRTGREKEGIVVEMAARDAVLAAIFNSDVGVDNEAIRTPDGGYVWFEIKGVEAARERTLDEVRDEAARQWREDELARRLAERGRALVARLDAGEDIAKLAQEAGLEVRNATGIGRNQTAAGLSAGVVAQVFSVPEGKAGTASSGNERIVLRVTSATVPAFDRTTPDATALADRFRVALTDDLLSSYVVGLQKTLGLSINDQAMRNALGGTN